MIKYDWQVIEPQGNLGMCPIAQGISYSNGALQLECDGKIITVNAEEVSEDLEGVVKHE